MRAFYELTKPGIAGYVMMTAGVSAYLASHGRLSLSLALHTMVGVGLATAGALALNQYLERDADAVMLRTRNRPIPSGRIRPGEALAFGAVLLAVGVLYIGLLVGWLPGGLTLASAAAYMGIYTPLKTRSYLATLAGGIPGAMPTLIGWTAATGDFNLGGGTLFAIAYLWQLPHVLGLSWMLREDYERVGFKLIPPHDDAGHVIALHMALATSALLPVSLLPSIIGYTGEWYFTGALLLSTAFLAVSLRGVVRLTEDAARRVFFASLLYHPALLALMVLDTIRL
ncbi:MAG: heme o synthase [Gemmatimonadota bacterium]